MILYSQVAYIVSAVISICACSAVEDDYATSTTTCERLEPKNTWRAVTNVVECIVAHDAITNSGTTRFIDYTVDSSYYQAPCGCTYHEPHNEVYWWGAEGSGCSTEQLCSNFRSEDGSDKHCYCKRNEPTGSLTESPIKGERTATLTVETTAFGKPVPVKFTTDDATNVDWIGIYRYLREDDLNSNPFEESTQFWTYTCGTQKWTSECEAVSDGTVTLNGVDHDGDDEDQWPINPQKYKVCHMREGDAENGDETGELLQPCKVLDIVLNKNLRSESARGTRSNKD